MSQILENEPRRAAPFPPHPPQTDRAMEARALRNGWFRPGLVLSRTSVTADPDGIGVLAPVKPTKRGSYIGAYRAPVGRWRQLSAFEPAPYSGSDDYVMEAGRCSLAMDTQASMGETAGPEQVYDGRIAGATTWHIC